MNSLLALTFAMISGLIFSRIVKPFNLPNVTGYLAAGLVAGPYVLNIINSDTVAELSVITSAALGFIAFSIGGEFKISNLRKLGAKIFVITLFEACTATILVIISMFVLRLFYPEQTPVSLILLLGAIAAATAPAATLMVVRQYKASGPVTEALLPVVASDDAIGLMIFSVCFSLAKVFAGGGTLTVRSTVIQPIIEIVMSLAIGAALGAVLSICMKFFKSRANRLCLMIAAVFLGVCIADILGLSSLLTCMMIGGVFTNMRSDSATILEGCERWTPPLFMLFFVLSGAGLNLSVIPHIGAAGIVYLLARSAGKYSGACIGSTIAGADKNVRKYLGITLLPQAGVAIGMAQTVAASAELSSISSNLVTIVLSAIFVYELIGPVLTRITLVKAGEIEKR